MIFLHMQFLMLIALFSWVVLLGLQWLTELKLGYLMLGEARYSFDGYMNTLLSQFLRFQFHIKTIINRHWTTVILFFVVVGLRNTSQTVADQQSLKGPWHLFIYMHRIPKHHTHACHTHTWSYPKLCGNARTSPVENAGRFLGERMSLASSSSTIMPAEINAMCWSYF